jgi:phenylpropionate dioxygenase-like ring-hydroxylating dioxygenase large terminal subunit
MRGVEDHDQPSAEAIRQRRFASAPASWFYVGSIAELAAGPVRFDLPEGRSYVAFRGAAGRVVVLDARCSHMGADLARGCVKDGRLACPLHGWEYADDGRCGRIPASTDIPPFARQQSFPVEERGGHVFFFNRPTARFPLPFFDGLDAAVLRPAPPFDLCDDVPWYLIGGNGFDRQHFERTHDRPLLAEPVVDAPHPFARRIQLDLGIGGTSYVDRITRLFAGRQSRMTVTSWCGSLVFATAQFRHTTTCGLVAVQPLEHGGVRCRVIVWVRHSANPLARWLVDPLHAMIRRHFIKVFFRSDLGRLTGTRYDPDRMIAADKTLVDYLAWLQNIHL